MPGLRTFIRRLAAFAFASSLATALAGPPDPPTITMVTAGNGEVTVELIPPLNDGGFPLSGMRVISSPAGGTDLSEALLTSPRTIVGLVNGMPYTFTAIATNTDPVTADSAPSAAFGPVTPDVAPDQPPAPLAQAGNTTATITIFEPTPNGGTPVTGYTVTSIPPGGIDTAAGTTILNRVITGLTNGIQYEFTVVATNAAGPSPASDPSIAVRPALPTATITVDSLLDDGVNCTLRKAIENANGEEDHPECVLGGLENTIVFSVNGTIKLAIDSLFIVDRSLTIVGNGIANTIIDGDLTYRVFDICGCVPITVTLRNLTVTRGVDSGGFPAGGGLFADFDVTVRIEDSAFVSNQATEVGGAIFNGGTLEVVRSTFTGNGTPSGPFMIGGAIANFGAATISDSTFSGNLSSYGGAVGQEGDAALGVSLTIANSTFSGNIAGDGGGAIASYDGDAPITLTHVTVSGNTAGVVGGGGLYNFDGAFNVGASIVAGNSSVGAGADCFPDGTELGSQGNNVFGTAGCDGLATGTNDFVGAANLLALANNGGTTQTMKPGPGSPALDRATCSLAMDQRGIARPQGASCDSGAFEVRLVGAPTGVAATGGNAQATVTFAAPGSAGDGTISGYTVTSSPAGGTDSNAGSTATSHVVTGLVNGTPYTFTVRASTEYGQGPASSASMSVTPATVPGAPTGVSATAGNAQATVTFTAPASNGGSAVTSYTAISNPGGFSASGPGPSITVSGLTNGTPYTFTVTATNAVGTGPASAASNSVTPLPATFALAVAKAGTGSGTVATSPAGAIDCGSTCNASVASGSTVTLVATPATGSTFAGWSGACTGTGQCMVTMNAAKSVTATFTLNSYTLTVTKLGAGTGLIASTSPLTAIECGATCSASFTHGTVVTLVASAAMDSNFGSWGGACAGVVGNCVVTMDAAKTVSATFDIANPPRPVNISTRGRVGVGDDVMIAGFVIGGTLPKTVIVRARGPSLVDFDVPGVLLDPLLQLFSGQTQIAANNDWQGAANAVQIQSSGFAPSNSAESAILMTLDPGAYTAIVTGVAGGQGVAIVEVFEVDAPKVPLINISTRGAVRTGADVLIAGIIIQGDGPQSVVVRARGPSLAQAGVPGVLANPMLQLFSGPTQIAVNDNWRSAANATQIEASGFAPLHDDESAILLTLQPGAYTAIVTGVGATTGIAIVEVFKN